MKLGQKLCSSCRKEVNKKKSGISDRSETSNLTQLDDPADAMDISVRKV